jgi:uncharacterized protein
MVNKLQITLCILQGPGQVSEHVVEVVPGSTVLSVLSGLPHALSAIPEVLLAQGMVGVWGRKVQEDRVLEANDRLEIYRPLVVEPKVARRERFGQQGARSAGLFAKRRPGAKPGY